MTKKYFFNLYCRNLKGYYGRSKIGLLVLAGGSLVLATLIVPLLVWVLVGPVASLLKTGFDYLTRKFTPKVKVDLTVDAISSASAKELINFSKELLKRGFLSHSSKCVKYALIGLQKREETQIIKAYRKEKEKLVSERLVGEKALEPAWSQGQLKKLADESIQSTRKILVNYVKNNNNNGKKLHQLTVAFFNKPKIQRTQSCAGLKHFKMDNPPPRKRSNSM
jgi:hypothetical protein